MKRFLRQKIYFIQTIIRKHFAVTKLNTNFAVVSSMFIASLMVVILLLGIRQLGWFQPLELATFDWMIRHRPPIALDNRLLVVEITEEDIQLQKRWPLSDATIATLLEKLQQYEPTTIGLDIYRDFPYAPGHETLLKTLENPNIIVIRKVGSFKNNQTEVPPPKTVPEDRIGFNDLVLDPDGIIRRNLMYMQTPTDEIFASFSLMVLYHYLEKQHNLTPYNNSDNPWQINLGQAVFLPLTENSGGYQRIDAAGYQTLMNYRALEVARHVTLTELLQNKVDPDWIKNKIVLIGTTAESIKDGFFTPYSITEENMFQTSGVFIHAHLISQMLTAVLGDIATVDNSNNWWVRHYHPLFSFWAEWIEIVWIISWAIIGGLLAWYMRSSLQAILIISLGLSIIMGIGFVLFLHGIWITVSTSMLAFIISAGVALSSKLVYTALYDTLTGLPNRILFAKLLRKSQHTINPSKLTKATILPQTQVTIIAVLFLDIDRFKTINLVLGHDIGDQLLINVTNRIRKVLMLPKNNMHIWNLARVGGDEFAILLENFTDIEEAIHIANTLHAQMIKPFCINSDEIFTAVSIGLAFGLNHEERDLLRDAQTAMYRAKATGKTKPAIFQAEMETDAIARFELEKDLRQAIIRCHKNSSNSQYLKEFPVYYQPIISLKTGKIIGFEALIRWQLHEKIISPFHFIPIAEETGLIIQLGEWVLREACRQMYQWQRTFAPETPWMISVNLSGKQFSQPDLIDIVKQALSETRLSPKYLKLEVTESIVMEDFDATRHILLNLKNLHIRLSIDDFGTGYSSLAYLTHFPMDILKVDKSFVSKMDTDKDNMTIVQSIIALARNLKMEVIAEGIETSDQLAQLRQLDVEYGQGYLFAKPLPREEAEALLRTDPTW